MKNNDNKKTQLKSTLINILNKQLYHYNLAKSKKYLITSYTKVVGFFLKKKQNYYFIFVIHVSVYSRRFKKKKKLTWH